jgi:DNA-binding MarR family transcriptional regulator
MGERDRSDLAAEAWRLMFGFFMHSRPQREAVLERLGLSPNESRSLFTLEPGRTRTMKELAATWRCDASTATWHINRLEALGLAERRGDPRDRRIRQVGLTPRGEAVREALLEGMFVTPPELLALGDDRLAALIAILGKLPTELDDGARP